MWSFQDPDHLGLPIERKDHWGILIKTLPHTFLLPWVMSPTTESNLIKQRPKSENHTESFYASSLVYLVRQQNEVIQL